MVSLDALWNELKATYQKDLSPASYNTWIETANPRTLIKTSSLLRFLARFIKNIGKKPGDKNR